MRRFLATLQADKSGSAIVAILIALTTGAVFWPAVHNGFVSWDDATNLMDNPYFRGFTRAHIRWMWTNHLLSHYVPLMWMSFCVDYIIWGREAIGYHLTNVILHSIDAGLFFLLSLSLLRRALAPERFPPRVVIPGAAFAALLFSLHPLRVESVAWVTERRDVLSELFILLALLAYLRAFRPAATPRTQQRYFVACFACFVLAVLSKEIAVVLPVILLLLDVYPLKRLGGAPGRWFGPSVQWVWLEKIPFFAVSAADSIMTIQVGMQNNLLPSVTTIGWVSRIAITTYALAFYLIKTVAPSNLSPLYALTPQNSGLSMSFAISLAVLLPIVAAAILLRRRFPALLITCGVYVITLIPVSGIFQNGAQVAADRYTYLSCLGWAVLAGLGFTFLLRNFDSLAARTLTASAAVLIFVVLSWLTRSQIQVWRDSDSLWSRAVSVQPSSVACNNFGSVLFTEGDTVGALEQYRKALAINPNDAIAHVGVGTSLLDLRHWDEAARELRLAISLMPGVPIAHNNLGHALAMQGNIDEAIVEFQTALAAMPENRGYRKNLERALAIKANPGLAKNFELVRKLP